jgi:hypothetical protein
MNRLLPSYLIFSFLLAFDSPTVARDRSKNPGGVMPGTNVLVFNYAQVPGQTLDRAEREVARILRDVGIETTWWNCNPALTDIHQDANCTQEVGPTTLIVRILPDIAVTQGVSNDRTMGLAFGNLASVSYRWVREEAAVVGALPSEILGAVAAHEIGHLLLGSESHSHSGIMRARWSRTDFDRSPLGTFTFTTEQAEQMRAEVAKRAREQAASGVVAKTAPK